MRRNAPDVFEVSVTYDVTTPESTEQGDYEDSGFEMDPERMTLRDALDVLNKYGPYERSAPSGGRWSMYASDSTTNYRTGAETRYAVHVKATPANLTRLRRFVRE